jgi:acetyltransferase
MSSGFSESPDPRGQTLAAELAKVIEETGLAVSGPNCMGNFHAPSSFFTLTDDRPHNFKPGPVALFGQSGGIVMAIKRTLEERGVIVGSLITSGNETGLTSADYITYFAQDPATRVIACYLESIHDSQAFLAACRRARDAGKPVVAVKLGASQAGRAAAAAHTGALAGSMEAFDAVAGEAGALRVRNLDDLVETVEYLVHAPPPRSDRLASITFSGGMRGLMLDAAEANGLPYRGLSEATSAKLSEVLGVGTIIGNPLDGGFAALTSVDAYVRCIETLLEDPDFDILLLQEELPRAPNPRKEENLRIVNDMVAKARKPIAFVSMISYGLNDYARAVREKLPNLAFMQEIDKTLRAVRGIARYATQIETAAAVTANRASPAGLALLAEFAQRPGPATLDEISSKRLLAAYGIGCPREELAHSEDEAIEIAARIGFPVVAKLVSAALPHKSDVGGVIVGIKSSEELRAAYRKIVAAVAAHPAKPGLDGILIAEMVSGGLELVLGASRDPEMGPVILFGTGGVDIELVKDVALAAPPLDEARALSLIGRTRASMLIDGYRGRPVLDRDALVQALVGFSNLVVDAGDKIDSIDVNPFLLRRKGGVALDALVVLKRDAKQ